MKKIWISLCFLVALCSAEFALNDDYDDDYWQNDYNDQWYQDELDKMNGEINYLDANQNKGNDKEIPVKDGAHNDDYQIEDNRYVSDEKKQEKQNDLVEDDVAASFSDESNGQDVPMIKYADETKQNILFNEDEPGNNSQDFDQDSDSISFEKNNDQNLPVVPNIDKIIKETQDLLKVEDSKIEDSEIQSQESIQDIDYQDINLSSEEENINELKASGNVIEVKPYDNSQVDEELDKSNSALDKVLQDIVDDVETSAQEVIKNVSADDNISLGSIESNVNPKNDRNLIDVILNVQEDKNNEDIETSNEDDDKTIEENYSNLNEDLDKLLDTLKKLSNEERVNQNVSENFVKQENNKGKLDNIESFQKEDDDTFVDPEHTNEDNIDLNKSSADDNISLGSIESNVNPKNDRNLIDVILNVQEDKNNEDIETSNEDDDKTIEDNYSNLNEDLDKLLDTLKKLSNEERVNQNVTKNPKDKNEVLDYEEKYDRPFREGVVLQMRQNDDYDFDEDSSESNASLNDDNDENIDFIEQNSQHVSFEQDAINNEEKQHNKQNLGEKSEIDDISSEKSVELLKSETETKLSDDEVQKLMNQFALDHAAELDIESDNFDRDVAVINMQINYEEPLTLCSPNYPEAYPANNIIDWMFDGDGMGIELNITDFELNGVLGDFLLVKPGGIDASGNDGLIFAYTLNSERKYRFMDVDRMFIRFHTHQGLNMYRGFCLSVKLMGPRPVPPEPLPIPEPSVPAVQDRHTVYFGPMNPLEFIEIREDFRLIIANMAELYVNTHDIPVGEMPISDVANITSVSVCNMNWPDFQNCVAVTFGVPLKYDEDTNLEYRLNEDDLKKMWDAYSTRDPFATLIRGLGLTEFSSPNDGLILILWLLIGCGILLVLVLFTLTLWKWNFFQDYTRMGSYSDTDSVTSYKKKDPALFPTPYQDLPALYSDQDNIVYNYKFAPDLPADNDSTRVDIGGYTNRTFTGDSMFDFDSDDEVQTKARGERYTTDV